MIDRLRASFVRLYGAVAKVDIARLGTIKVAHLKVDILSTFRYDQLDLSSLSGSLSRTDCLPEEQRSQCK